MAWFWSLREAEGPEIHPPTHIPPIGPPTHEPTQEPCGQAQAGATLIWIAPRKAL